MSYTLVTKNKSRKQKHMEQQTALKPYEIDIHPYHLYFPTKPGINKNQYRITNVGAYSITHTLASNEIANLLMSYCHQNKLQPQKVVVTDITGGMGGDTINFSRYFKHINSIEKDPEHFKILKNNVDTYCAKNITLYQGDSISMIINPPGFSPKTNQDIIYLDPPWGGKEALNQQNLHLYMDKDDIEQVVQMIFNKKLAKIVAIKVPPNFHFRSFIKNVPQFRFQKRIYVRHCQKHSFTIMICSIYPNNNPNISRHQQ